MAAASRTVVEDARKRPVWDVGLACPPMYGSARWRSALWAERQPDPGPLEKSLDALAEVALELLRVRALEADGDVGDGRDSVQVDEDRDEPLVSLAVVQRPLEQARLPVLARGVQPDVVTADGAPEELPHVLVAIDDVLGRHGARIDERVDVLDHCARQTTS